ncbi:MAG: lysylphosphatidylglycerol synthase transmembrane domain-containing protein [Candidatus Hydrogenedentes bacterium]|nr:lysylphosphatidylglycerol synthase transmembrane domain-containing protein [Candidatus Hydrogenedentota bacterium]
MLRLLRNKRVTLLLRVGVSVGLLTWVLSRVDLSSVWHFVSSASPLLFCLAFLAFFLSWSTMSWQLSRTMRLHGSDFRVMTLLNISLRAFFYGFVLPGDVSAGAVKWYLLSKYGHGLRSLAAILYVRIVNLTVLMCVGLGAILVGWPFESKALIPLLVAALAATVCFIVLLHTGFMGAVAKRLLALPVLPRLHQGKVKQAEEEACHVLAVFTTFPLRDIVSLFLISILYKLTVVLSMWLLARAIRVDISYVTFLWVHSGLELIQMLPISFSGVGVRDVALVVMLRQVDVPSSAAVAVALGCLAIRVLQVCLGGLLVLRQSLISEQPPVGGQAPTGEESSKE